MGHAMSPHSTARRIIPLRRRSARNAPKPRAKKPTQSFPTADQVAQIISQLWTLVGTGEAQKVDGQLEQLLVALGLDPASPDAFRDGFLLLACLRYGVGRPRRHTAKNAEKLCSGDNMILLREIIQLMGQGLNPGQAINKLAGDQRKAHLFKFKPTSSNTQRADALRKRLKKITNASLGWDALMGSSTVTAVEEMLINRAFAGVEKRNAILGRS
jgi:hypothetical protein